MTSNVVVVVVVVFVFVVDDNSLLQLPCRRRRRLWVIYSRPGIDYGQVSWTNKPDAQARRRRPVEFVHLEKVEQLFGFIWMQMQT